MNSTGSLREQAKEILFLERRVNWPLLWVMAAYCISKLTTAFRDVETTNFESKKKKKRKQEKEKKAVKSWKQYTKKFKDYNNFGEYVMLL